MKYIQAPAKYDKNSENFNRKSLFLAGGISNCPNWQKELVERLKDENITLFNPKRENFDTSDPGIEEEQINWEYNYLKKSDAISFWFPKETVCPITLYELGGSLRTDKKVFIGIHPEYSRIRDIKLQTKLVRPEIEITYNLKSLSEQVKKWAKE